MRSSQRRPDHRVARPARASPSLPHEHDESSRSQARATPQQEEVGRQAYGNATDGTSRHRSRRRRWTRSTTRRSRPDRDSSAQAASLTRAPGPSSAETGFPRCGKSGARWVVESVQRQAGRLFKSMNLQSDSETFGFDLHKARRIASFASIQSGELIAGYPRSHRFLA